MEHTESEWPNTERPDPVTEPPAQTIPSDLTFETQPFQPDGGFGIGGMLALLLILGAAAVGIGALAYYISQFFYFIFLFPFLMGLVLGAVAVALVKIGKIRAHWLASLAGLLAAILVTFTIHYLDYQKFRAQWQNMQAQGPIDWRQVPKAEREHMRRFAQVTNFMEYLDARAHEGVELKRGGGQGKGFNLGYVGTYLYWLAEIGLVAGLIIAMTRKPTRDPFCTITQAWKTERCGDNFAVPEPVGIEAVAHAVQEGAVGKLADLKLAAREAGVPTIPIRMYVYASPQHSDFTPVEVVLNQFFTNKNGQQEEIELLKVTYPPQALAALEQLCRL